MTKYDAVFLKHFAQLILGLMAFAFVLILAAHHINDQFYGYSEVTPNAKIEDLNPAQRDRVTAARAAIDARLAPAATVNAGETGRAALLAAEEAARKAAASQVAYGGTLDGAVINQNLCSACHGSGAGGAPHTKELWAPRIATGTDLLVKHAIEGYQGQAGIMPARGGNPSLTDEQVRAAVEYLVNQYK